MISGAFLTAALTLLGAAPADQPFVWWEGEAPTATNFKRKTWFSPPRLPKSDGLSAGDWLTNDGKRAGPELFARYSVAVPKAGRYHLWTRKFWKHGPFRWRFGTQDWRTCGRDIALADTFVFQTHICANWVSLGEVTLAAGDHAFELRLLAKEGEPATACFDAFLLIRGALSARGKLKPGERSGRAAPGWWAFEPAPDPFTEAALDLRYLNEKTAGETGFVTRKGGRFVLGSGEPVRFWGVNAGPGIVRLDRGSIDYLARRLARVGVNCVRFHGPVFDRRAADPATVDAAFLDQLHYFVAALKKQGIYVKLSFYFPLWFNVKPAYGLAGYDTIRNKRPFALLTFNPRMQAIYRSWARGLLTTKNPYTGLPLAKDPAVAMLEIINEDSYFFWTFSEKNVPRVQMRLLERAYGTWLAKRYGSVAKAVEAWGGRPHKNDAPADGRAFIYPIWHLTAQGLKRGGVPRRRLSDQLQFLSEHQRGFYESVVRYFRDDLGAKSLVSCSNWKTADPALLDALERHTYTAGDVIDRHGYFGGKHTGPRASYSVSVGDIYADRAGVLEPAALPFAVNQIADRPHIVSEIGWPNPNRFRAECPVLCAAYGSLQGLDGFFFFALNGPGWSAAADKFPVSVPTMLGQFPAAALLYRRGDVKEGDAVFHEVLRLRDLYAFKGSAVREPQSLDALRKADVPPGGSKAGVSPGALDPLAFFVGPVKRTVDGDSRSALTRDLSPFIDRAKRTVRSATGELVWDYGAGLVTINTPRTQGAAGFLAKAGAIRLKDVTIESKNDFGSILVTSLDGKPIRESARLLIQVMTEERPYGWATKSQGAMHGITGLGGHPLNLRTIEAAVTLHGRPRLTARPLDPHGYARRSLAPTPASTGTRAALPADALYTIIE